MKLKSLRSKLLVTVSALVIGSGLIISLLETKRFRRSLHEATVKQGAYLCRAIALEASEKILGNDLISLQDILNHQVHDDASLAYLFVIRDHRVLAHTFSDGVPADLIGVNTAQEQGSFKCVVNKQGEHYLDIAWPIFGGKAGVLRIGMSEKAHQSAVAGLWIQMTTLTLGILTLAILICFWVIRRVTRPLETLTRAVEGIDEKNLELEGATGNQDEVGRLTGAFQQMLGRMRDFKQHMENKSLELDRAHHQTKSAFEIIQKIWAQEDLDGVCAYLIRKFCEIVACNELLLFIFSRRRKILFVFSDGRMEPFTGEAFDSAVATLSPLTEFSFIPNSVLGKTVTSDRFECAARIAAFPIHHENHALGALLIPCPGNCRCNTKELDVIGLILGHSSEAIQRAVSRQEELLNIQEHLDTVTQYCGIVGRDPKMQAIYHLIEDIAPSDTTVLIQGESGTGKELVARAIHHKSLRAGHPFVVINCAAYPASLIESELFGHEKGAFTGAVRQKAGRFELADGGTVFLDEISEIPLSVQIKLLRVLQNQRFERVGGEKTLAIDVRILAATNQDLLTEVKAGRFREDLYYRLHVIPVQLPPLKKRHNDIPLQARYFLRRFAREQGKDSLKEFSSEVMRLLLDYSWPGNVRELENCIEHAVVLARGKRIEVPDLPSMLQSAISPDGSPGHSGTIVETEVRVLREVLEEVSWNKKQAAHRLGISRSTLYRKLKKYGIHPPTIH